MELVMGVTTESGASPLTANPLASGIEKLKLQTWGEPFDPYSERVYGAKYGVKWEES